MSTIDAGATGQALVRAIEAIVSGDSPATRGALYRALLNAMFLVPISGPEVDDDAPDATLAWRQVGGQSLIELAVAHEDGVLTLPIFTSSTAFEHWFEPAAPAAPGLPVADARQLVRAVLELPGGAVFSLARRARVGQILVDPAGPVAGTLTATELVTLAEGRAPKAGDPLVTVPDEHVTVPLDTRGVEVDEAATGHLRAILAGLPTITGAWLFRAGSPEQPCLAVGVLFAPGTPGADAQAALEAVASAADGIDVVRLGPGPLLDALRGVVPALLERSAG